MWLHFKLSFSTAWLQAPLSLSSETPKTVKFLSLNLLYAATTAGFSWRQGLHQLAQKSTKTYLPLKLLMLMGEPVRLSIFNSGAC